MTDTREARLFVLAGADLARSFALGERTTLGRAEECDVVLHDRSISRRHAVILRQDERWFVQDLGSTNGVSKDGMRGERIELHDGDEFKLGDLPLRLRLVSAGADEVEFDSAPPVRVQPTAEAPAPSAPAGPVDEPEIELADEIRIEERGPAAESGPTSFRPARVARRTGLFAADLEQQPFWLRCVIVLALLALCGGLAYGSFLAVRMLRGGP